MNVFASRPFLGAIASAYFPSQPWTVEDHAVGGQVFRLLRIADRAPITTHPFLDLHEPVGVPRDDPSSASVRWLPNVSRGLVTLDEFRGEAGWQNCSGAPTVVWRQFATWNDYVELLRRRSVLREDQRRRRRLEDVVGPLVFRADDRNADVLPTAFTWKSMQWRRMGVIDLFADSRHRTFFYELRSRGLLQVSTLRAGDRLLALWLGAVYEQRWYGWIFAFTPDPALSKYSVGRQLLYPMLEESYRAGHTEFDFSNGCEPYKLFFATHVRPIAAVGRPPVLYRVEWMIRERLRSAPRMHARARAMRQALQREMFRVKCMVSPRRSAAVALHTARSGAPGQR